MKMHTSWALTLMLTFATAACAPAAQEKARALPVARREPQKPVLVAEPTCVFEAEKTEAAAAAGYALAPVVPLREFVVAPVPWLHGKKSLARGQSKLELKDIKFDARQPLEQPAATFDISMPQPPIDQIAEAELGADAERFSSWRHAYQRTHRAAEQGDPAVSACVEQLERELLKLDPKAATGERRLALAWVHHRIAQSKAPESDPGILSSYAQEEGRLAWYFKQTLLVSQQKGADLARLAASAPDADEKALTLLLAALYTEDSALAAACIEEAAKLPPSARGIDVLALFELARLSLEHDDLERALGASRTLVERMTSGERAASYQVTSVYVAKVYARALAVGLLPAEEIPAFLFAKVALELSVVPWLELPARLALLDRVLTVASFAPEARTAVIILLADARLRGDRQRRDELKARLASEFSADSPWARNIERAEGAVGTALAFEWKDGAGKEMVEPYEPPDLMTDVESRLHEIRTFCRVRLHTSEIVVDPRNETSPVKVSTPDNPVCVRQVANHLFRLATVPMHLTTAPSQKL